MIRLGVIVLVIAAVGAALLHVNIWVVLVPVAILFAWPYLKGTLKTRCPQCGKRIKISYTTCHHCGWSAAPGQPHS